ncbi:MAG: hypothetical protein K5664_03035, partial [Firmicutes bacterium]|nr:hypothetical protein [Bacillota bacterium]
TEGVVATAGTCLRWLRDTIYNGEKYSVIDSEAKSSIEKGSSIIFVPSMDSGKGVFYGVSLSSTRGDFASSVIEGVAFEIRSLLEGMNAYEKKQKIILFGGGAKSDLWCQIISDITKMEIAVPSTEEAAGAGAARAAAKAVGRNINPLSISKIYKPQRDYEEKYKRYREISVKI